MSGPPASAAASQGQAAADGRPWHLRAPWKVALALLVLLLALATRLYTLGSRSIWLDEDAQARKILAGGFDLKLIERAATQQQPPIDYYAEYIGLQVFGVTAVGARVHAAIWGSLTVLLLWLLLRRSFKSWWAILAGTLIALLHPVLLVYSQEARPIACGVFFFTLQLYALHGFILGRKSLLTRTLWGVFVLASSTAFLLSVGFQPVVSIATTSAALLPALLLRQLRWRAMLAWLLFGLAFLVASPILKLLLERGGSYVARASLSQRLLSVLDASAAVGMDAWTVKYEALMGHIWPFAVVAAALGFVGLALGRDRSRCRESSHCTLFLLAFVGLFPWIFDSVFRALVDYELKLRYYTTLTPALVLVVAGLCQHAREGLESLRTKPVSQRVPVAVLLTATLGYALLLQGESVISTYERQRADWASLYALFQAAPSRGVAYMVHFKDPGRARPLSGFTSQRFYYPATRPKPIALLRQVDLVRDYRRRKSRLDRGSVYVVSRAGWQYVKRIRRKLERDVPGVNVHIFSGLSAIQVRDRADLEPLFEALVEYLPRKPTSYRAYEVLTALKRHDGDRKGADRIARNMRALYAATSGKSARRVQRELKQARKKQAKRRKRKQNNDNQSAD